MCRSYDDGYFFSEEFDPSSEDVRHIQQDVKRRIEKMKTGLYDKFKVNRTDGRDAPGEKHHGCQYFVLDINHDQYAIAAIRAYAEACRRDYPVLAADLIELTNREQPNA